MFIIQNWNFKFSRVFYLSNNTVPLFAIGSSPSSWYWHCHTNTPVSYGRPFTFPFHPLFEVFVSKTTRPQRSKIIKRYCITSAFIIGLNSSFLPSLLGVNVLGIKMPSIQDLGKMVIESLPIQPNLSVTSSQYVPGCFTVMLSPVILLLHR